MLTDRRRMDAGVAGILLAHLRAKNKLICTISISDFNLAQRPNCVYGQNICFYVSLYFFPFNLVCNMTIFIFFSFNPNNRLSVCVRRKYVLAWCSMLNSLQYVMQHGHVLKKLNFDLLTPRVVGLRAKYLLPGCCICDSPYLICNMIMF